MTRPSEAVLLAAGMGTRLGRRTLSAPKPLIEVNGISILADVTNHLSAVGIPRLIVVIGHLGGQIQQALGDAVGAMRVEYAVNHRYSSTGTAHSLDLGLRRSHGHVLIVEGDVLFERSVLEHFLSQPYDDATLLQRWNPLLDGSLVELGADGDVARCLHRSQQPPGYRPEASYKTVNLHRFSPAFINDRLRPALRESPRKDMEPFELPFDRTVAAGGRVRGVEVQGRWVEIDDENDLRRAETMFAGAAHGSR